MDLVNDDFIQLYAKLYVCANSDGVEQLDIYNQLKSLYDYFDNCVFEDKNLEEGKTYILPIDVEVGMFDEADYAEYTNPDYEYYEPDIAPFVESHNMSIEDGMVWITLNKGTQFIFNGYDGHGSMTLLVDGYPVDWYGYFINENGYDGAVPFVIKA